LAIEKKPVTVEAAGMQYRLSVNVFDSFDEDAFRVKITKAELCLSEMQAGNAFPERARKVKRAYRKGQ